MSKEFEELVIKKLDNLELAVLGNGKRLDNLEEEIKETKQSVRNLETEVGDLKQSVGNLETEVGNLQDTVLGLENSVGNLENENKSTRELLNSLNDRFTVFDYEINTKIDTLFDAFITNTEKASVHEEQIVSLDSKVIDHDIRISNLEDKVLTA